VRTFRALNRRSGLVMSPLSVCPDSWHTKSDAGSNAIARSSCKYASILRKSATILTLLLKAAPALERHRVSSILVVTGTRGPYDMVGISGTTFRGLYRATMLGVAALTCAALLGMTMASSISPISERDRHGILITILRALIDCCRNHLHLP
jgi:hypothetical protein